MTENIIIKFFTLLGTVYGAYIIFIFLKYVVYLKILVRYLKKPIDLKKSGRWAAVTGCTDGIGKAFAYELARIGMDVILISRSKKKLYDLATNLTEEHNVKTKIIVADFTNTDKVIPEIQEELNDLDIGVLINNVGVSTGVASFLECDKNEIIDLIEINVKTTIRMCSVILPNMVKKKKGVIINMSSLLAILHTPQVSCYGASKAFIARFSTDLNREFKQFGITVHCLKSSFVATKMTNLPVIPWLIPTAETYARSALKTIGLSDVTTGYSFHDVFECCIKLLERISQSLCSKINGFITLLLSKYVDIPSTAARK